MSLQVWLPLNGDIRNQGLSNITMLGSPNAWDSAGKMGKCALFNGNVGNVIYYNATDFNYIDNFSWAVWVKTKYTGTAAQYIFTNGRADAGAFGYGLQCSSSTSCTVRFGSSAYSIPVTGGEWTHLAFTKSGNNIKLYKNGAQVSEHTFSGTMPTYTDGNGLGIGCFHCTGNIYAYYGSVCDFRIYNHCLSAKEVKEISKGLVLHYKLDNNGIGNPNLINNSYVNTTASAYGFGTRTVTLTQGKTYTFTVNGHISDVAASEGTRLKTYIYKTDWSWSMIADISSTSDTNATITFTAPSTNIFMITSYSFKAQSTAGSNVTANWYKMEEGTKATPWCPSTSDPMYTNLGFNNNIEYDCSGYGYDGTITGTIGMDITSPRYSGASIMTNNQTYIQAKGMNTLGFATKYTISWWSKIDNMDGKMAWGYYDGNHLNIYPGSDHFHLNTGDGHSNPFVKNGVPISVTPYQGAWHHYVLVCDYYTTATLYIDGVAVGTATPKRIEGSRLFISGWNTTTDYKWTGGSITDFRLYGTLLSADDVKELYRTSASIANNGTMLAYEFKE
ncbi:MAG: LamG domain-containing protein [Bacteroidales bacterium]|nr:LamG domain-containing protein [Candidatus Scybalousia scybalohippi]